MKHESQLQTREQVNGRINEIKRRSKLHKAIVNFKIKLKSLGLDGSDSLAVQDLELSCEEQMVCAAVFDIGVNQAFAETLVQNEEDERAFIASLLDGSWAKKKSNPFKIKKEEAKELLLPFVEQVKEAGYDHSHLRIYDYEDTNLDAFEKRLQEYFSFVLPGAHSDGGSTYDLLMECSPEHGENEGENVGNYNVRISLLNEGRDEVFVVFGNLIDARKMMDDSVFFLEMDELTQDHMDFAHGVLEELIKRKDIRWNSADDVLGSMVDGSARCAFLMSYYEAAEGVNARICLWSMIDSLTAIFELSFNYHFESLLAEGINPLEDPDYEFLEGFVDEGVPNALFSLGMNLIAARNPLYMAESALRYCQGEVVDRDGVEAYMERMATQYLELSYVFKESNDSDQGHAAQEDVNPFSHRPFCWMNNLPYCNHREEMARLGKHVTSVYGTPE